MTNIVDPKLCQKIYTVCEDRVYLGSAGQGLINLSFLLFFFTTRGVTSTKTPQATTSENKENTSPAKQTSGGRETNESEVSSTTTQGDEEFQVKIRT